MEVRRRCVIMGNSEKVRGENSSGQAQWRRCRTSGMDTEAEDMQDDNRRDVGRRR